MAKKNKGEAKAEKPAKAEDKAEKAAEREFKFGVEDLAEATGRQAGVGSGPAPQQFHREGRQVLRLEYEEGPRGGHRLDQVREAGPRLTSPRRAKMPRAPRKRAARARRTRARRTSNSLSQGPSISPGNVIFNARCHCRIGRFSRSIRLVDTQHLAKCA
jgi:hypothetical protein